MSSPTGPEASKDSVLKVLSWVQTVFPPRRMLRPSCPAGGASMSLLLVLTSAVGRERAGKMCKLTVKYCRSFELAKSTTLSHRRKPLCW
ncbi:hypothetical protein RRG08_026484 [Elysia crispata]|uniref:Uncharacterized protein n=1 Tax=Elysia crispata TaxID=231223 RepID=A0AAE0Y4V7_9GAST|nr:hypothetical protein RRG08_026484 [Elysia crispata]